MQAMFNVEIVEMETLPATLENSNQYIVELFKTRKAPKLSKKTVNFYLESISHLCDFVNKSLLVMETMDIENYLNAYYRKGISAFVPKDNGHQYGKARMSERNGGVLSRS